MRPQNFARTCLPGARIGRWTVVREAAPYSTQRGVWCRCDCGTQRRVPVSGLQNGKSHSCGCLKREVSAAQIRAVRLSHGDSSSCEFRIWKGVLDRCLRPRNRSFRLYGGRGIRVCTRWLRFDSFLADMGRRPSACHSIERRDRNGHYEPGNCYWATPKEQARNTSRNRWIEIGGRRLTLVEWSEVSGVPATLIQCRLNKLRWDPKRAVFQPRKIRAEACREAQRLRWREAM